MENLSDSISDLSGAPRQVQVVIDLTSPNAVRPPEPPPVVAHNASGGISGAPHQFIDLVSSPMSGDHLSAHDDERKQMLLPQADALDSLEQRAHGSSAKPSMLNSRNSDVVPPSSTMEFDRSVGQGPNIYQRLSNWYLRPVKTSALATGPLHVSAENSNFNPPAPPVTAPQPQNSDEAPSDAPRSNDRDDGSPRPDQPQVAGHNGKATIEPQRTESCFDCHRRPVFDPKSGLCQVCIKLPKRCCFCELRCDKVGVQYCHGCVSQVFDPNQIARCPSCTRQTIFITGVEQCSYCRADVRGQPMGTRPRQCSGCSATLGFARPLLHDQIYCWCCNDKFLERRRLHPIKRDDPRDAKPLVPISASLSYRRPPAELPIGLYNVGNTCFMNAVLQCLLHIPVFRNKLNDESLTSLLSTDEPLIFYRELVKLSRHVANKVPVEKKQLRDLKTALAQRPAQSVFLGYEQQDAHEFLVAVLSVVSDELTISLRRQHRPVQVLCDQIADLERQQSADSPLPDADQRNLERLRQDESNLLQSMLPTESVLQSEIAQTLECSNCHISRPRLEYFHHLSLDLPAAAGAAPVNVQSLLSDYFSQSHTIVDRKCSYCNCADALQTPQLQALPQVLVCHIKRFSRVPLAEQAPVSDFHAVAPTSAPKINNDAPMSSVSREHSVDLLVSEHANTGTLGGGGNHADDDRGSDGSFSSASSGLSDSAINENNEDEDEDRDVALLYMPLHSAANELNNRESFKRSGRKSRIEAPADVGNDSDQPRSPNDSDDDSVDGRRLPHLAHEPTDGNHSVSTTTDHIQNGYVYTKSLVHVQLSRRITLLPFCTTQRLDIIPVPAQSCSVMTSPRGKGGKGGNGPEQPNDDAVVSRPNKRAKQLLSPGDLTDELNQQFSRPDDMQAFFESDMMSSDKSVVEIPAPFVELPSSLASPNSDIAANVLSSPLAVVESDDSGPIVDFYTAPIEAVRQYIEKRLGQMVQVSGGASDAELCALATALQRVTVLPATGSADDATGLQSAATHRSARATRQSEQADAELQEAHRLKLLEEEQVRQNALRYNIGSARLTELGCTSYTLYAVVHHKGTSAVRGHYNATVRKLGQQRKGKTGDSKDDKVIELDDNLVEEKTQTEAWQGLAEETAYLLFYLRDDVARVAIKPLVQPNSALHPAPAHMHTEPVDKSAYSLEPEPTRKYTGLINHGATCHLNALLQSLFMTPEFRHAIYVYRHNAELGPAEDSVLWQMQQLFLRLQFGPWNPYRTVDLIQALWEDGVVGLNLQQDLPETRNHLLASIVDGLQGTQQHDLIDQLYSFDLVSGLRCQACSTWHRRSEKNREIILVVRGHATLESSLRQYIECQSLDVNNMYRCTEQTCMQLTNAEKVMKLGRLPCMLTFQLHRSEFDPEVGRSVKFKSRFEFPSLLDLREYVNRNPVLGSVPDESDLDYELFAVLVHSGTANGGHYYVYIKKLASSFRDADAVSATDPSWYEFNDNSVYSCTENEMQRDAFGSADNDTCAYLLTYRQVRRRNVTHFDEAGIHNSGTI